MAPRHAVDKSQNGIGPAAERLHTLPGVAKPSAAVHARVMGSQCVKASIALTRTVPLVRILVYYHSVSHGITFTKRCA